MQALHRRQRFRQEDLDQDNHRRRVHPQEDKHALPGQYQQQHAPQSGGHGGRQRHQHGDQGKRARRSGGAEDIPRHGAREGGTHAGADALQEPEQQHLADRARPAAPHAGRDEQQGTAQQDRLAAEAVRQRSAGQVKQGETGQVAAESQVHLADVRAEVPHHRGHGGQVHIDTERTERYQRCEQGQQPGGVGI